MRGGGEDIIIEEVGDAITALLEDLDKLCSSKNNNKPPSLSRVREKLKLLLIGDTNQINTIISQQYANHPFFHEACKNNHVTFELIECILRQLPQVASYATTLYCPDEATNSYALHYACQNEHSPSAVVELLVEEYPQALSKFCILGDGIECDNNKACIQGLPLHYYLERSSNYIDIDIVKLLIKVHPKSLVSGDKVMNFTPIFSVLFNSNIGYLHTVLEYIIDNMDHQTSSTIKHMVDGYGRTPLHVACRIENTDIEIIQMLVHADIGALQLRDNVGRLPIHILCGNRKLNESVSLQILQFMLNNNVDSDNILREGEEDGNLPLHLAVHTKSTTFCKIMIDAYPQSLKEMNHGGNTPLHEACRGARASYAMKQCRGARAIRVDTIDTIGYMLDLYNESIHVRSNSGALPIHRASLWGEQEVVAMLLNLDPSAASEKIPNKRYLPLHLACCTDKDNIEVVQILYDAYPEAISIGDTNGKNPLDLATRRTGNTSVITFLQTQLAYAKKAQDQTAMSSFDIKCWLPLHHALQLNVPLGSIQLLVRGNPLAVRTADYKLAFALHIACEYSSVQVVQFLAAREISFLGHNDTDKNSPLHYACRGCNCSVAKYLIKNHASLTTTSAATVNANSELPLHLLCNAGKSKVDCDSIEYIETIWLLLLATIRSNKNFQPHSIFTNL